MSPTASEFESRIRDLLPDLERVHTDIDAHPELSMEETRTAVSLPTGFAPCLEVTTGVGKTGVVGGSAMAMDRRSCGNCSDAVSTLVCGGRRRSAAESAVDDVDAVDYLPGTSRRNSSNQFWTITICGGARLAGRLTMRKRRPSGEIS
jgi:hypothetical protein